MSDVVEEFGGSAYLMPLLQQMIDIFDIGIAVVDRNAILVTANDTARLTLFGLVCLGKIGDPVTANSARHNSRWDASFGKALKTGYASFCVGVGTDRKTLALRRIAIGEPSRDAQMIVLIGSRRTPCGTYALNELATEKRLTQAEREIIELLACGHSPGQVAKLRRSSEATVRTQIKTTLQKTGASSFHTLLLSLAAMPPIAGLGENSK